MTLLGPSGEPVELDGTWIEAAGGSALTWWIRTEGTCVWGSGYIPGLEPDSPHHVQSLNGQIRSDFTITGEILWLGPVPPAMHFVFASYAPLSMLIEFGDAGVVLREDREPGARGPHCPDQNFCPAPLVLQRAD